MMSQLSFKFAEPVKQPRRPRGWQQLDLFAPRARRSTLCPHCGRYGFWSVAGQCPAARSQAFFKKENEE